MIALVDVAAVGVQLSVLETDGDRGTAESVAVADDHALTHHLALHAELRAGGLTIRSDLVRLAFTGEQLVALVGLRVDAFDRDTPHLLRPYAASELGYAGAVTSRADGTSATTTRLVLQPLALGLDLAVDANSGVRAEVTASYYRPDLEDVLALSLTLAYVHAL